MRMSSLVAYEDSESEDDSVDHTLSRGSASVQADSCAQAKQTQEARVFNASEVTPSPARLTTDTDKTVLEYHDHVSDRNLSLQTSSWLPRSQGKIPPAQTPPLLQQSFNDLSNPSKRLRTIPSGIRPYIPKRQRLTPPEVNTDSKYQPQQLPGNQSGDCQILSDVPAKVKQYLSQKPSAAGIPRRLLLSLGAHQGPVNTVQWCPVPHASHLLLSASMDKTFKVWDGAESGRCLRVYTCHSGAVRDACWTPCGRHLLTGSFDNMAVITDVETGQPIVKLDNQFKAMCVALHPSNPEVFLCGGYSSAVKAWDSRSCKVVNVYKAGIQQTLDILFLKGGSDFITSSDCVSRDSADRTLIAWDYQTTAKVSNQIYHERYTCPSLALHPLEDVFAAQTNGNYMALFSSQQPYRMNKRRRYEGHKVEGYAVQCEFSRDGTILASGSSTGSVHFFDYHNAHTLHTLHAHRQPCLSVSQHPVLPATAATCDWGGEIKVWH